MPPNTLELQTITPQQDVPNETRVGIINVFKAFGEKGKLQVSNMQVSAFLKTKQSIGCERERQRHLLIHKERF